MTGSLLFVAPGGRLAELSDYELALRVLHVSIDLLLCVVTFVSHTILWRHCMAEMATESGRQVVDRPGVLFSLRSRGMLPRCMAPLTLT